MARLKSSVELNANFNRLVKAWPDLTFHLYRTIGKFGRLSLRYKFLAGQELTLRDKSKNPTDDLGRWLVSSYVFKQSVNIASYPVNLFEKGRGLRDGSREPGKYIITRKLKTVVNNDLGKWVKSFELRELQKEFDKV